MNKSAGIVSTIVYILLFVVLAAAGVFAYQFFNNGQKTFTVSYGAITFTGKNDLTIYEGEYAIFQTNYLIGDNKGYSLSVLPNPDAADFDFIADGDETSPYSFLHEDISPALEITQYPASFAVYIPQGFSMTEVLTRSTGKAVTGGQWGSDLNALSLSDTAYFSIVVKNAGESETVTLNLKIAPREVANG